MSEPFPVFELSVDLSGLIDGTPLAVACKEELQGQESLAHELVRALEEALRLTRFTFSKHRVKTLLQDVALSCFEGALTRKFLADYTATFLRDRAPDSLPKYINDFVDQHLQTTLDGLDRSGLFRWQDDVASFTVPTFGYILLAWEVIDSRRNLSTRKAHETPLYQVAAAKLLEPMWFEVACLVSLLSGSSEGATDYLQLLQQEAIEWLERQPFELFKVTGDVQERKAQLDCWLHQSDLPPVTKEALAHYCARQRVLEYALGTGDVYLLRTVREQLKPKLWTLS